MNNKFVIPKLKTHEELEQMSKKQLSAYITTFQSWNIKSQTILYDLLDNAKESIYD